MLTLKVAARNTSTYIKKKLGLLEMECPKYWRSRVEKYYLGEDQL
jgi:hypothetical protein